MCPLPELNLRTDALTTEPARPHNSGFDIHDTCADIR